ncbi:MAG: LamG-like jellyroll fold domain-containing protein [Candidatus Woesearchaeota archaeon]
MIKINGLWNVKQFVRLGFLFLVLGLFCIYSSPDAAASINASDSQYLIAIGPVTGSTSANYVYLSIFNPATSNNSVVINYLFLRNTAVNTATYQKLTLRRINASSTGTLIAQSDIPKKNTNSANATVEIRYAGPAVTYPNGVNARIISVVGSGAAGSLNGFKELVFNETNPLVLRPGEGVALYQEAAGSANQRVNLLVDWEETNTTPQLKNEYIIATPKVAIAATVNYTYHSFFNPAASGKTYLVKRIDINVDCNGAAVYTNTMALRRITAASVGTLITQSDIPKKDTATNVSTAELRNTNPTVTHVGTANARLRQVTPCGAANQHGAYKETLFESSEEPLIIKQGEGLALISETAGDVSQLVGTQMEWEEISNTTTPLTENELMYASPPVTTTATINYTYHSIFNPVGSGKVAIIKRIEIRMDAGTANKVYQPVNLQRINAASAGTLITQSDIMKKNSATNTTVMELRYNGPTVTLNGSTDAAILTITGPGAVGQLRSRKELIFNNEKIVLRPGEGLAMYSETAGGASQYAKLYVDWEEEPLAAVPAAQNEYALNVGSFNGVTTSGYNYTSFFNPALSNVTAIVTKIFMDIDTAGTAVYIPFTIRRITSASGGTSIAQSDIPKKNTGSNVSIMEWRYANPTVAYVGSSNARIESVQSPGALGTAVAPQLTGWQDDIFTKEPYVIKPGEGLTLYQEAAGDVDFRVKFMLVWKEISYALTPATEGNYMTSIGPVSGSLTNNYVYATIYNPLNSSRDYIMRRIDVRSDRVGALTAPGYIPVSLQRINSSSGGTLMSLSDILPKNTATNTSTAELRSAGPTVNFVGTTASDMIGVMAPGAVGQEYGKIEIISGKGDEIILHPGEGLAMYQQGTAGDANMRYRMDLVWNESIIVTNTAPTFTQSIGDQSISHSVNLSLQVNCTDLDFDTILYFDNTSLFDINSSGYIFDNPTQAEAGVYNISITCGDGVANTSSSFLYTITNSAPTTPTTPSITSGTYRSDSFVSSSGTGSSDSDGDSLSYSYQFTSSSSGTILQSFGVSTSYTTCSSNSACNKTGDIKVQVRVSDGSANTDSALSSAKDILNTAPTQPSADTLTPTTPIIGNQFTMGCSGSTDVDPEDSLTYFYGLYDLNDSVYRQAFSTLATYTLVAPVDSHDTFRTDCYANDSSNVSSTRTGTTLRTVSNSAPVMSSSRISPSTAYTNDTLLGYCNATDADNNNLTYHWKWYLNTVQNTSGTTSNNYSQGLEINVANVSSGNLSDGQNWTLSCQANDSSLTSSWLNSSVLMISPYYGSLNVTITSPATDISVNQNSTFQINATVTCTGETGAICGTVYANARYNASSATPDTLINTTSGGTPLYMTGNGGMCYQESANESTACGGLNTGTYANESTAGWNNLNYTIDGNWSTTGDTGGLAGDSATLYINYTKPSNSLDTSVWRVSNGNSTGGVFIVNISLPILCWNYSSTIIRLKVTSQHGASTLFNDVKWDCYNGTDYLNLSRTTGSDLVYEEAIWWNISGTSNPQTSSSTLSQGQSWSMNWTVNTTGTTGSSYYVDVLFNSSYGSGSVPNNDTANRKMTVNSAPVLNSSRVSPTIAYTNDTLLGYCNATDSNLDNLTYNWKWYLNAVQNTTGTTSSNYTQGLEINVANVSSGNLSVGQNWTLSCQANDSSLTSSWMNSSVVAIRAVPAVLFVYPTPNSGTSATNTSIIVNASINISVLTNLSTVTWNWNGTNYTMYNNSLVLLYNFNNVSVFGENVSSNKTFDSSTYGNNGTCQGMGAGCNYTLGKYGSGITFDGVNDLVNVSNPTSLNNLGPATWSMWVNRNSLTNYGALMYKSDSNVNAGWWIDFRSDNGGELGINIVHSTTNIRRYTNASILGVGQWFNLVITWTNVSSYTAVNMYINGVETAYSWNTTPAGNHLSDAAEPLTIGYGKAITGGYFNGSIDEVMIWNRNLSASEISQLYKSNLYKYNTSNWQFTSNQSNLTLGGYTYFACADDTSGVSNCTETRTLTITNVSNFAPVMNFSRISPSTAYTNDTLLGYCNATDADNNNLTYNWKWFLNAVQNTTGTTTNNYTQSLEINVANIASGNLSIGQNWTFSCQANDSINMSSWMNSSVVTIIDTTPPSVQLDAPAPNDARDQGQITFTYTPSDPQLQNCTLYTNRTGVWMANATNSSPINMSQNNFLLNLSYGTYLWNVQCCDSFANCGFAPANRTLQIVGDFAISDQGLLLSSPNPVENQNITLSSIVLNLGNKSESNILVRFYEGDPDTTGIQIGSDQYFNFSALQNITVNMTWTTKVGGYNLFVKADPANAIVEFNESNNKANKSVYTAAWQIYYGNITGLFVLGTNTNNTIIDWLPTNLSANIYIADSDSSISWQSLKAITRNITGNSTSNTTNDFEEIDTCLAIENLTDSVNATYSSGGSPIQTNNYTIYQNNLSNVPVVKSTNTTNFYSGILWDSADSGDTYYTCNPNPLLRKDIIFVTTLNAHQAGAYGTYDYEIRIPAKLRSYRGSDETVSLYYETTG